MTDCTKWLIAWPLFMVGSVLAGCQGSAAEASKPGPEPTLAAGRELEPGGPGSFTLGPPGMSMQQIIELDEHVRVLEASNLWQEVAATYRSSWSAFRDVQVLDRWLQAEERHRVLLLRDRFSDSLTPFKPPADPGFESPRNLSPNVRDLPGMALGGPIEGGIGLANKAVAERQRTKRDLISQVVASPVRLVSKTDADNVLAKYDCVRDSVLSLRSFLVQALAEPGHPPTQDLLAMRDAIGKLIREVASDRESYVSYSIVSPRLAEVQRLLWLADYEPSTRKMGLGFLEEAPSVVRLQEAASVVSDSSVIRTSNQEVREQFFSVMACMKELAGNKVFEDLKVRAAWLGTDLSGIAGGDAWLK